VVWRKRVGTAHSAAVDWKLQQQQSRIRIEPGVASNPLKVAHGSCCGVTLCTIDNERIREICLKLPHVAETLNWGHHLVYWVGDRDIGGKMFAMTDLDGTGTGVLWFHCGAERFHELLEREGIRASPYLAKAHWVTVERWNVLRPREIEEELRLAHHLIYEKLPKRTKAVLALPEKERAKVIRERKKALAARAKKKRKQLIEPFRPFCVQKISTLSWVFFRKEVRQ
jgi:predicted DNA-binding protein (MmcQ/YjbR family)